MDNVISVEHLSKTYGKTTVLSDVSLTIPKGAVYGFIGPNGAGKSTTMKIILGLVQPSKGEVEVFGERLTSRNRRDFMLKVGGMIEEPAGYSHLTGIENLEVVRRLLGFPRENIEWALDIVGLGQAKNKKVSQYSLGMKQRLGIALAICRRPALLVLDEPTNGLDPYGIDEMRDLLAHLAANEGTTIMVSSHILSELEKVSTHFGILNKGKLIFEGSRSQLLNAHSPSLFVRVDNVEKCLSLFPSASQVGGGVELPGIPDHGITKVCETIIASDLQILEVTRSRESLEEIFMSLTAER
ncbi:ABC transporter ATP-binding protein [Corynebacterium sp. sy039]|uniref:ABC transporter ATP-binding protein n=2 Tax=Corynebacterium TaxID=1716 RepID=UPI0011B6E180|nr:ABC transporter ATP-binding protein [Corynebacterium sp. sy039]QDZ43302.1 ABC transporter ATP-binding protein [Corynebacterium sp. sy039]